MKIINNLKGIRTQRKIAQKQLAMDTGYDPRTIRRVELGEEIFALDKSTESVQRGK